ncbi:MAG: hypothetical protein HQL32_07150, partial [Planctomycetes bacterium]|nr:hypothetical protein [Planctomycetota bacterium]
RGQASGEDVFSPGYFAITPKEGDTTTLIALAAREEKQLPQNRPEYFSKESFKSLFAAEEKRLKGVIQQIPQKYRQDDFLQQLAIAIDLFIVNRDGLKTVIAGFPWFTDWGRDTFIAALGMLKAGRTAEVKDIILRFARFEEKGTLPNIIEGEEAGNRDTVDAQLWFFQVVDNYIKEVGSDAILQEKISSDRSILNVLDSIAQYYISGTENGIVMDQNSGLIFSPSHYTWMDTNYPACTPRKGYPVEIQALWHGALNFLSTNLSDTKLKNQYQTLAKQVKDNFLKLFWNEEGEYLFDNLQAEQEQGAFDAIKDYAFRSNQSIAISLGILEGEKAQKVVKQMMDRLVIPSGIRSLSEDTVSIDGFSYCGSYSGAEGSSPIQSQNPRKFAYHNGTAWSHPLGEFMIAYVKAFDNHPDAKKEIQQLFECIKQHLGEGGIANISEIMDGSWDGISRHYPRGCSEQAWGATEFFRAYAEILY